MFGPAHDILELPQIPRDRGALQTLLNEARHRRRVSRLARWAALNMVAWALLVVFVGSPAQHTAARPPVAATKTVYLPFVGR